MRRRFELTADRYPLDAIIGHLGPEDTSVLVCDLDVLGAHLDHLTSSFPDGVMHAIAIKTMPHPRMLEHLVASGFALEAASMEEVALAVAAGARAEEVVFDSPAKTALEIRRCEATLPGLVLNCNSVEELSRTTWPTSLTIGLRINPLVEVVAPDAFNVSRPWSKFGVPITELEQIQAAADDAPFTALHMHVGSQVEGWRGHIEAVTRVLEVAEAVTSRRLETGGPPIDTIDIGGGLRPEPFAEHTSMQAYAADLQRECPRLFDYRVITEFGQWVHSVAGWVATRVEYVEHGRHPRAIVHVGADLFTRQVYMQHDALSIEAYRPGQGPLGQDDRVEYDICGPLCFEGDVLSRSVSLPRLHVGDWLVIADSGANTFALWSRHCSRAVPAVLASAGGRITPWSSRQPVV